MGEIKLINRKVKRTQTDLVERGLLGQKHDDGFITYHTSAPNDGRYEPSSHEDIAQMLNKAELKNGKAVVLGSGLGGSAAAISLFFKNVTAWEYVPILVQESRRIWAEAGFPYNKIDFKQGDFLEDADLKGFSFIYFYKPFVNNFIMLMRDKLMEADKGTYIACIYPELSQTEALRESAFPSSEFKHILIYNTRLLVPLFHIFERL